jgi:hypothetical protein
MINERIEALRKRERVCWDMSEVFLHARDAHGLHDMGVEIQGIQWALRELEAITESKTNDAAPIPVR